MVMKCEIVHTGLPQFPLPTYLCVPHILQIPITSVSVVSTGEQSSVVQLSFAMQQTNRKRPSPAAFHNTEGLSTSAELMPRKAGWRILKVSTQRPGLSELKWLHPVSQGRCTWGSPPCIPLLFSWAIWAVVHGETGTPPPTQPGCLRVTSACW